MVEEATVSSMENVDIVVIGGGIAGVSAAYALARANVGSVRLVETEPTLAFHTTGRSAAQLIENYGAAPIRQLTLASLGFFNDPPDGLVDAPLLTPRGILTVGAPGTSDRIQSELEAGQALNPTIVEVTAEVALELVPVLRPSEIERVIWEPQSADIDVAGLHQAFVRGLRRAGATFAISTRVDCANPEGAHWRVDTVAGSFLAGQVVNAAGAWGDLVATSCGVKPVGLEPKRRTAFMIKSAHRESGHWPLFGDANNSWYVKPDGAQFMCSPSDEVPSAPLDAKPDELDVARAIERINQFTTLDVRAITSSWAGLRTFAPDRSMVIGPDPDRPTFHWCVGQGGTGIQSAPAAGQLVADLLTTGMPGPMFDTLTRPFDLEGLTPSRLRSSPTESSDLVSG